MIELNYFGVSASSEPVARFSNDETEFYDTWTEAEIIQLQKGMLIHAIQEARDRRRSKSMRKDAWKWLMSEEDPHFVANDALKTTVTILIIYVG